MTRIGVVSQVPPPVHGQTIMTLRFLEALNSLGLRHRLVDRRFSASIDEVGRVSVRKLTSVLGLLVRTLVMLVSFRPTTTVFFVTTRPGSFLVDWLVSEVLRVRRARVVLYVHSVGFTGLAARGGIWRFAVRRLFGRHVEVVTLGEHLVVDIDGLVSVERHHVIANTPGAVPGSPPVERSVDALFLSNLIPGKGAEEFARIVSALPALVDRSLTSTLAGAHGDEGVVRRVRSTLEAAPDGIDVDVVGALDTDAKWAALRSARCLAFTSTLTEAQPLTIAEALAVGTPVVAFRLGGIPDLVVDGVNGFLVEPGDEIGFSARVAEVAGDDALWTRLSCGATNTFERTLSFDAYAGAWRAVLHEVER